MIASTIHLMKQPRHLTKLSDLSVPEFRSILTRSIELKEHLKHRNAQNYLSTTVKGHSCALLFQKRSTRTRVSVETACARLGMLPMFLNTEDIHFNKESLYDMTKVMSSMASCIVARVNDHNTILELSKHSSVPIVNALSDQYHPLQAFADCTTLLESFGTEKISNLTITWIGAVNNVFHDLLLACAALGIKVKVATSPDNNAIFDDWVEEASKYSNRKISAQRFEDAKEAVKDSDVVFTDVWVSMGEEAEAEAFIKRYEGFKVTEELMSLANKDCKFLHCMPRTSLEVTDDVYYSNSRSLVFQAAENRFWTSLALLEFLLVKD